MNNKVIFLLIPAVFYILISSAHASIWGESVNLNDLSDQRTFSSVNYNPSSSEGGLDGYWPYSFEISWNIEYDTEAMLWNYEYTLSSDRKDVSHFILELTDGITEDDIRDISIIGTEGVMTNKIEGPGSWGEHPSNPGYPNEADMYGIKFDTGDGTVTYSFVTGSDPVWGNFYAKSGKDNGDWIYAYNNALAVEGFESDNPIDFIVRPDGGDSPPVVPEPVSAILFVSGGVVLAYGRYKKCNN